MQAIFSALLLIGYIELIWTPNIIYSFFFSSIDCIQLSSNKAIFIALLLDNL